ncbi:MAG: prenyltransferase/squalene oxidase repeat-containing protein [Chthoniobacteraceae bacterium]
MYDPLQAEEQAEPHPEPEPKQSFLQKFQQKLAESRYFMLSCVIHTVIVILAGSVVLYKAIVEPPDFVAEGGDGMISATDDLTPPPETPADAVPTEQVAPTAPNINSPTIDVIQTTATNNSFKVAPTQVQVKISTNADLAKTTGSIAKGLAGGVGNLPGSMRGRVGTGKAKAMTDNKMKTKSEQAVLKGLRWLQKNQNADGSWGDGNKGAMTGFGLLCFLGHGETPESQEFGLTVNKAVQWILDTGTKYEGRLHMGASFNQPGVYEHAICSYALGEYFSMTQDDRVKELFKQAIGYIVQGQGPGGGWMYSYDKTADDLSVGGWQIQALKAAHLSKLDIYGVDQALDKAMAYIERVKGPKGGYGYRDPADKYSLTGVGILCQLFWKGERGTLRKGMEWLLEETEKSKPVKYKGDDADLYAWYYHTQACLMFGGSAWTKWNRWFQDEICDVQNADGSWPAPGGKTHGPQHAESMTGKVYRTSLCILMLEVFYRYMPTTQG